MRGKVALNGTNAKYSTFLSNQMWRFSGWLWFSEKTSQVCVSEWWIWSKNRILSKLLKSYSQIRVLKATAAKIPWTISPKLSLSRQFRSVEAMSVGEDDPSSLEFANEMGEEEEEDWFIGKVLSSFLNHKGSWRQFRLNFSRIGHKTIKPTQWFYDLSMLKLKSARLCSLAHAIFPGRHWEARDENHGSRVTFFWSFLLKEIKGLKEQFLAFLKDHSKFFFVLYLTVVVFYSYCLVVAKG